LGTAPAGGSLAALYDPLLAVPANVGSDDHYQQRGTSFALFTHNIFALTDSTDLTVGLRFTTEDKHLTAQFNTPFNVVAQRNFISGAFGIGAFADCNPLNQPGVPVQAQITAAMRSAYCVPWLRNELDAVGYDQERGDDEWSGVISLRQEFSENVSAYASFSRGYKGGGFNMDRNFNFTYLGGDPNSAFGAETVDAYEIGLKTSWFDNALLLNLAVYHNEYEDYQLNTYNGIQFVVTTAPEVIADGAELDVIWRTPIEGLFFQGGVAYTDAVYGDDCTLPCAGWVSANRNPITGEPTLARLPGSNLTNAPQWTSTASFTYERPIGSLLGLAYVDARYVDDQNTGSDLRPSKEQPSYTLVNARLGIGAQDDSWALEFWARNLFDENYAQVMFDVPLQQGTAGPTQGAFLGDPRTYGITLRARY